MAAVATLNLGRTRTRILVASADPSFRKQIMERPVCGEAASEEACGGAHALARLAQIPCDTVYLDRNLPDLDAFEVAEFIRKQYPQIDVEFVDSRIANAGPQDSEVCLSDGESHGLCDSIAADEAVPAKDAPEKIDPLPGMIGTSPAMQQMYRLARMGAGRNKTVLSAGETGTGKELVAQAVHHLSPRGRHPFVVVNCAAIPEALLEAELFGHARGAFTGAVQSRLGRVHVAQGGTLFLDEVGELPLSMQAKLLRFLQNGEVQRLGSSDVYRVDVRVVCATNVSLLELVQAKQFRVDLYYRLAVFPVALPPLRERTEDIPALSTHFLAELSDENTLPPKHLSAPALALLQQSHWAGNVRELQHAIERAFILSGNESQLRVEHFQQFEDATRLREI